VIVCAYNEEKSIGALLDNLAQQKAPGEVTNREIVVVASGCTDHTVDVVRGKMGADGKTKLIVERQRSGKAQALNRAFQVASGDYVVLVPADVLPAEDALFNLLLPFEDTRVSAVSGRPMQDPAKVPRGFSGYLANMTYRLWARLMTKLNDRGEMAHCSGEFMAFRSDIKTALPPECAADDSYIAIVARRRGHVRFAPEAVCYNLMPSNVADYINQRRRWLFGHFQTKKMTGEYPTVLDTVVLSRPGVALRVLAEEIGEQPKAAGYLGGALLVEAIIYSLSMLDRLFSRSYGVWPVIRSTKAS
jgi:cellulose synthase/poly-beta-1,6-N-acetylglucosamine synthase-like glycosyltransferase